MREAMFQSAKALIEEYPGVFTVKDLTEHIDDLSHRFSNKALGDTIFRIGSDLRRKLGQNDRVVGAIRIACSHGGQCDRLIEVFAYGLLFRARDESGQLFREDIDFIRSLEADLDNILTSVCGFDNQSDYGLIVKIKEKYRMLSTY
jgi:mannitol-1-phosphate 5-dehydrogenase